MRDAGPGSDGRRGALEGAREEALTKFRTLMRERAQKERRHECLRRPGGPGATPTSALHRTHGRRAHGGRAPREGRCRSPRRRPARWAIAINATLVDSLPSFVFALQLSPRCSSGDLQYYSELQRRARANGGIKGKPSQSIIPT